MTINQRIEKIKIHYFGDSRGNHKKFIERVGVSSNTASNWMKDGYNVGKGVIDQILKAFPEISYTWLSIGEGEMLKNGDSKIKATGDRFNKILEYKGDTIESIHEKTNIPLSDIENLSNGIGPLNFDVVLKILTQYKDISLQWLLNGKGEMVIQEDDTTSADNKDVSSEKVNTNYRLLPIINLDIAGGSMNQEVDTSEYTMGFIPFLNAKDGDICCYISGNSMTPLYPPGSVVQLRKIELWREFLEFGNIYAIDLIDGRRLIKEIRKGEDPESLTLHSFNREYEDAPVPKHIIRNIWQVIQKLEKVAMW